MVAAEDAAVALGELDEALALHGKRLVTSRRLGDIDGVASSLWAIAQIEFQQERFEEARARIAEAWPLIVKLGRPDGIAAIGGTYGELLAAAGVFDEARNVLGQAAAAFRKIGNAVEAARIEATIADINKQQS